MKKFNKLFFAMLAVFAIFCGTAGMIKVTGFQFGAFAANELVDGSGISGYSTDFGGGNGTSDSPYQISKGDHLKALAQKVNSNQTNSNGKYYKNLYYKLTADIDLGERIWTPIGNSSSSSSNRFLGTFDGNGYTIKNLTIDPTITVDYLGLFGYVSEGAKIYNFVLENVSILSSTGNTKYVGSVAGYLAGNAIVSNVYVKSGKIEGCDNVGSVVGKVASTSAEIYSCKNEANVYGNSSVGGIAGLNSGKVIACIQTGNVGQSDKYTGSNVSILPISNGSGTKTYSYYKGSDGYYYINDNSTTGNSSGKISSNLKDIFGSDGFDRYYIDKNGNNASNLPQLKGVGNYFSAIIDLTETYKQDSYGITGGYYLTSDDVMKVANKSVSTTSDSQNPSISFTLNNTNTRFYNKTVKNYSQQNMYGYVASIKLPNVNEDTYTNKQFKLETSFSGSQGYFLFGFETTQMDTAYKISTYLFSASNEEKSISGGLKFSQLTLTSSKGLTFVNNDTIVAKNKSAYSFTTTDPTKSVTIGANSYLYIKPGSTVTILAQTTDKQYHSMHVRRDVPTAANPDLTDLIKPTDPNGEISFEENTNIVGEHNLNFVFSDLFEVNINRNAEANIYNYSVTGTFNPITIYVSYSSLGTASIKTYSSSRFTKITTDSGSVYYSTITGASNDYFDSNVPTIAGYKPELCTDSGDVVAELSGNQFKYKYDTEEYKNQLKNTLIGNAKNDVNRTCPKTTTLKYNWIGNENMVYIYSVVYTGTDNFYPDNGKNVSDKSYVKYSCGKTTYEVRKYDNNILNDPNAQYVGYKDNSDTKPSATANIKTKTGLFLNGTTHLTLKTAGSTMILPGFELLGYVVTDSSGKVDNSGNATFDTTDTTNTTNQFSSTKTNYYIDWTNSEFNGVANLRHIHNDINVYIVFGQADLDVDFATCDTNGNEQEGVTFEMPYVILPFASKVEDEASKQGLQSLLTAKMNNGKFSENGTYGYKYNNKVITFKYGMIDTSKTSASNVTLKGGETLILLYKYGANVGATVGGSYGFSIDDTTGLPKLKTSSNNYVLTNKPFTNNSDNDKYEFDDYGFFGYSLEDLSWNFDNYKKALSKIDETATISSFPIRFLTELNVITFDAKTVDNNRNQPLSSMEIWNEEKTLLSDTVVQPTVKFIGDSGTGGTYTAKNGSSLCFYISNQKYFRFVDLKITGKDGNINNGFTYTYVVSLVTADGGPVLKVEISDLSGFSNANYNLVFGFVPSTFDLKLKQYNHNGSTSLLDVAEENGLMSIEIDDDSSTEAETSYEGLCFMYFDTNSNVYRLKKYEYTAKPGTNYTIKEIGCTLNDTYSANNFSLEDKDGNGSLILTLGSVYRWFDNNLEKFGVESSTDQSTNKTSYNVKNPLITLTTTFEMVWNQTATITVCAQTADGGDNYTTYDFVVSGLPSVGKWKFENVDDCSKLWKLVVTDSNGTSKDFTINITDFITDTNLAKNLGFLKIVSKSGEKSDKWSDIESTVNLPGETVEIYFVRNVYKITYVYKNVNGGSVTEEQKGIYGASLTVKGKPSESPTGYTFSEWNENQGGGGKSYEAGSSIQVSGHVKLYAIYKGNESTLTFHADEAEFASDKPSENWNNIASYQTFSDKKYATIAVTYGGDYPSIRIEPIKAQYKFEGWWTQKQTDFDVKPNERNAGKQFDLSGKVTELSDTEYYAWWSPLTISVTIDKVLDFAPNPKEGNGNRRVKIGDFVANKKFGDNAEFVYAWNALNDGIVFDGVQYFKFEGLYRNAEYTGDFVQSSDDVYDHDKTAPSEVILYAKWALVNFEYEYKEEKFSNQLKYNGESQVALEFVEGLPSSPSQISIKNFDVIKSCIGGISFAWKKEGQATNVSTDAKLSVLNVWDSGKYRLTISLEYNGEIYSKTSIGEVTISPADVTIKFFSKKVYDGSSSVNGVEASYEGKLGINGIIPIYVDENLKEVKNVFDAKYALFEIWGIQSEESVKNFNFILKTKDTNEIYENAVVTKTTVMNGNKETTKYTISTKGQIFCEITPYTVDVSVGNQSGQANGAPHTVEIAVDSEYLEAEARAFLKRLGYTLKSSQLTKAVVKTSGGAVGVYTPSDSDKTLLADIRFFMGNDDYSENFEVVLNRTDSYEIKFDTQNKDKRYLAFDKISELYLQKQNGEKLDIDGNLVFKDQNGNLVYPYAMQFAYCDDVIGTKALSEGWNYFSNIAIELKIENQTITLTFVSDDMTAIEQADGRLMATFLSSQISVDGEQTWLWLDNWKSNGLNRYPFENEVVNSDTACEFKLSKLGEDVNAVTTVYPEVRNFAILTLDKNLKDSSGNNLGQVQEIVVLRKNTSQTIDLFANDDNIDTEIGLKLVCYKLGGNEYTSYTFNDSANIKDTRLNAQWEFDFDSIKAYIDNQKLESGAFERTYNGKQSVLDFKILSQNGNVQTQGSNVIGYLWTYDSVDTTSNFAGKTFVYKDVIGQTITAQLKMTFTYKSGGYVSKTSDILTVAIKINPFELEIAKDEVSKVYDKDDVVKENGNDFLTLQIDLGDGTFETLLLSANYASANAGSYKYDSKQSSLPQYNQFKNVKISNGSGKTSNYTISKTTLSGEIFQIQLSEVNFGNQSKSYDGTAFVYQGTVKDGGLLSGHTLSYTITSHSEVVGTYSTANNGVDVDWEITDNDGNVIADAKRNYDVTFVGSLQISNVGIFIDGYTLQCEDLTFDNDYHGFFVTKEGYDFDGHALPQFVDVVYTWTNDDTGQTGKYTHNEVLGLVGYKYPLNDQDLPRFAGNYTLVAHFVTNGNVSIYGAEQCDVLNINCFETPQTTSAFRIKKYKVNVNVGDLKFENVARYVLKIDTAQSDAYTFACETTNLVVDGTKLVLPVDYKNLNNNPVNLDKNGYTINLLYGFVLNATISNQKYVQGQKLDVDGGGLAADAIVTDANGVGYTDNFDIVYNISYTIEHWYNVNFDNDGSVSTRKIYFGSGIINFTPPSTKKGYVFVGWKFDADASDQKDLNPATETYPAGSTGLQNIAKHAQTITFKAIWKAGTTSVKVQIYTEDLSFADKAQTTLKNEYSLKNTLKFEGFATESNLRIVVAEGKNSFAIVKVEKTVDQNGSTTEKTTDITTITLSGYGLLGFTFENANANQSFEIESAKGDGDENVFKVYLSRNRYTLYAQLNNTQGVDEYPYYFEQTVLAPANTPTLFGYTFQNWTYTYDEVNGDSVGDDETFENLKMPSHDLIVVANFVPNGNTRFAVIVKYQKTDGTFDDYKEGNPNVRYFGYVSLTDSFAKVTYEDGKLRVGVYQDEDGQTQYDGFASQIIDIEKGFWISSGTNLIGKISANQTLTLEVKAYRNSYRITYVKNNGQKDQIVELPFGGEIDEPSFDDFTKLGYAFGGWYTEETLVYQFNFQNATMPANDFALYAKWEANEVGFVVLNKLQTVSNEQKYTETRSLKYAKTGDVVQVIEENGQMYLTVTSSGQLTLKEKIEQTGFDLVGWTSGEITVSGTEETVVELKFDRKSYKLTVNYNNGKGAFVNENVRYGTTISETGFDLSPQMEGYQFVGYFFESSFEKSVDVTMPMPSNDLEIFAKYSYGKTTFGLVFSTENLDGTYDETTTQKAATTNDNVKIVQDGQTKYLCVYTGEKQNEKISLEKIGFGISKIFVDGTEKTDFAQAIAVVKSDGSTIVKIQYTRNSYTFTKNLCYDGKVETQTKKYGEEIDLTKPERAGFKFGGWYKDSADTNSYNQSTMPAENLTLYAKWTADVAKFKIIYTFQTLEDQTSYEVEDAYTHTVSSITGYQITMNSDGKLEIKNGSTLVETILLESFDGFRLVTTSVSQTIAGDGSTVVTLEFDRETYTLTLVFGNGQQDEQKSYKFDEALEKPDDPIQTGYNFDGWFRENTFENKFVFANSTMPAEDLCLYAKWSVAQVEYTVVVKEENVDGTYAQTTTAAKGYFGNVVKVEFDGYSYRIAEYNGETVVSAVEKPIQNGFTFDKTNSTSQVQIAADGTTIVVIQINRNTYRLEFMYCIEGKEDDVFEKKFGETLTAPTDPVKTGYVFDGWYTDSSFALTSQFSFDKNPTMPALDLTLWAKYTPADGVTFVIEYFQMDTKGNYPTQASLKDKLDGVTGEGVEIKDGKIYVEGQVLKDLQTFDHFVQTTNANQVLSGIIAADGSLVLKVYFERNQYTVTIVYGNDKSDKTFVQYFQTTINEPDPTFVGYTFAGWYTEATFENKITMPFEVTKNATVYAKWEKGKATFELTSLFETLDGGYDQVTNTITAQSLSTIRIVEDADKKGQYTLAIFEDGVQKQIIELGKTGFEFDLAENTIFEYEVAADSSTQIRLYFARKSFVLTYVLGNGQEDQEVSCKFEQIIQEPAEPIKTGYTFVGWYKDANFGGVKFDFKNATMPAENFALYAKFDANANTKYKVEYFMQKPDGTYGSTADSFEEFDGITDLTAIVDDAGQISVQDGNVVAKVEELKSFVGFTLDASASGNVWSGIISAESELVLKVYFARNTYTLTLVHNDYKNTPNTVASYRFGQDISLIQPAEGNVGFTFDHWYTDVTLANMFILQNATMPANDLTLYGKWRASEVKFELTSLFETLDGGYDQVTNTITAQSLSKIKIQEQDGKYTLAVFEEGVQKQIIELGKTGFDFDVVKNTVFQYEVAPDSSTRVTLCFARKSFDLTYVLGNGQEDQKVSYKFEQIIQEPPEPTKDGYKFGGWYREDTFEKRFDFQNATMPAENFALYAKFVANSDTEFKVEYYLQNVDGSYDSTASHTQLLGGTTDFDVLITSLQIQIKNGDAVVKTQDLKSFYGFEFDADAQNVTQGTITTETLVLKVYFARQEFEITFVYNDGQTGDATFKQKYQSEISIDVPTRQGYGFAGWFEDDQFKTTAKYTQDNGQCVIEVTKTVTLYAKWQAGDVKYVVNHFLQNADDDDFTLFETIELSGTTDEEVKAQAKIYTGFTFDGENQNNVVSCVVKADGSSVLELYYKRNVYDVIYNPNGGQGTMENQSFKYGQTLALSTNAFTRSGFEFVGWTTNSNDTTVQFEQLQDFTFVSTQNVDLYAIWKIDRNGLQVSISSDFDSVEYGDVITIVANVTCTADVDLTYTWYFENTDVKVDASTLTIQNINQSGKYRVVVTAKAKNTTGAATFVLTKESNQIDVQITQRILVVEFENVKSFVYNGKVQMPNFAAKIKNESQNAITVPTLEAQISSQGQTSTSINAGSYNLKAILTDTNFVLDGSDNTDFEITPAQIDVSSKIKKGTFSKSYSAQDPALTLDVLYEPTGENVKVTFERTAGEEVGYYDIFLASPACTNANFEILDNIPAGNQGFQITKSTGIIVKVGLNQSLLQKVYDGQQIDVADAYFDVSNLTFTPNAIVTKITFKIENNARNVGEYKISIDQVECSQYEKFELDKEYVFAITPKTLSYNGVQIQKVYDKTSQCDLILTDDILEIDKQSVSLVATFASADASDRTKIDVQLVGDVQNYVLDSAFENLYGKIDPMQVKIVVQNVTLVYGNFDRNATTFDYQLYGKNGTEYNVLVDNDQFDGKLSVQSQTKYKPGKYKIVQNTLVCTTGNYIIADVSEAYLQITPKQVKAEAKFEKFYDGNDVFDGQITLDGKIEGDDVYATATFESAQAKSDMTVTIELAGADADCYELSNPKVTGSILDQTLTLVLDYGFDYIVCNSHSQMQYTSVDLLYNKTVLEGLVAKGYSAGLPTPWAEGWNFEGWFDQKQDGNKIENTTVVNADFGAPNTTKTIYARYSYGTLPLVVNMITYDSQSYDTQKDGGSVIIDGQPYVYGQKKFATFNDKLTIVITPNQDFDFVGFFESDAQEAKPIEESAIAQISGNTLVLTLQKTTTLYAKFKTKQFDLILDFDTTDSIAINAPFNVWTKNQNTVLKAFDKESVVTLPVDGEISRRGYILAGWTLDKDSDVLAGQDVTVLDTITLYAIWQAQSFDITLNANTGDEDASLLNADSGKFEDGDVQKVVVATFDQVVETLPVPQRKGYTFAGWVDSDRNVWIENQTYKLVTGKELFATWQANTIVARIQTVPALEDIFITSAGQKVSAQTFGENKVWTIEMKVTDVLSFECSNVTGYTLDFVCDKQIGVDLLIDHTKDQKHNFDISRMIQDFQIKILYKSDLQTYTIMLNQNWGSLNLAIDRKLDADMRAEIRDDQNWLAYDGDKTYTLKVFSGETVSLQIRPYIGYKILAFDFAGANVSGNLDDTLYLQKICADGTGTITFEPSTNIVKISVGLDTTENVTNDSMGYLNVFKVTSEGEMLITGEYQNFAQVAVKTGESIKIQPIANDGFAPVFDTTMWQVQKELDLAGDVVISYVDGQIFVTASNISCNAEILVPFRRLQYALVPKVAILDDGEFTLVSDAQNYVEFEFSTTPDGTKQIDGTTFDAYYFMTRVVANVTIVNNAYNPVGWYESLDKNAKISDKQSLTITIDQDKQILFVLTIKTYSVTYTASENGSIQGNQNQTVKHGKNSEEVIAVANAGYEFEKWQIFDDATQSWIDDQNVTTAERQDQNVTSDLLVRAVFAPSQLRIKIQTRFLDGYDENGDPIFLDLTQDIAYVHKIGDDGKLFELDFVTASNLQTEFALEITQGYSIANVAANDDGSTKIDLSRLHNIVVSGYVTDIQIMVTIKANENKFEIGFVEYNQNGTIAPYYITAQNRILVTPENCASENGKPRVSVIAKTNKSFNLSAEFLNGYEFVTDDQGRILIGIVAEGQTTVQYLENVSAQGLNGIYISRISVNVQNVSSNAKIYVFTKYTKYPVTFHVSDDASEDRVYELTVNSDFGEIDADVARPTKTGLFFMGWFSQENGSGLKYIDSEGNVLTHWNIEHTDLYAFWEVAYVTYNVVYVPGDQAIAEQIGLSNTLPSALKDFTSNTQFKYYVDNQVIFTAPRANQNYQFAYIQIGETKYDERTISFVIPQDTTAFEQTIYVYYKVAISVTVSGGGQATVDGKITVYLLENESATLVAEAYRGYVFVGWTEQNDQTILSANLSMTVPYSSRPKVYCANFDGRTTELKVSQGEHGLVSKVFINGSEATLQNGKYIVKLGDYIGFECSAEAGYYLYGWFVNGIANGTFDSYRVTVDDVCRNELTFVPNFVLANISYTFVYDSNAGSVKMNSKTISSGFTLTTDYLQTNVFQIAQNKRYLLDKVTLNDQDITNLVQLTAGGGTLALASNRLDMTKRNVIEIQFKKIYWLDSKSMFEGLGTEANPYTIMSPEQFAMMCYLINNNVPVDAENKINYASGYYVLSSTVDFEDAFWVPIGTEENPFDGTMRFDYSYKNVVLDKYYSVICYDGLFGYVTDYAKFVQSTQPYKIAIIVVSSFVGVLAIITVVFVITRHLKRKKYQRQSSELLNIPKKPLK